MSNKDKFHTCCFFGHRKVSGTEDLRNRLYKTIENMIVDNGVDTFLFGSKSDFDSLCLSVVSELKEKYSHVRRIYVRAEFPYISDDYKNHLLQIYEDTYYPPRMLDAGKAVYVERNYEMIERSKFCITYFNENYLPPRRKNSRNDLVSYQPKSGTRLAYEYAIKKGSEITNMFLK